jgi:hypothetical protein
MAVRHFSGRIGADVFKIIGGRHAGSPERPSETAECRGGVVDTMCPSYVTQASETWRDAIQ